MGTMLLLAAVTAVDLPAAEVIRRYPAEEARQGVAADARYLYAVDNSRIAKYDKTTGAKVGAWSGDPDRFPHINACVVVKAELVCAASNYPYVPMTSSVEVFDPRRMVHLRSIPIGQQAGSLTWVDWRDGAWWATFANYDGRGGEPGRGHQYTRFVRFDTQWRATGGWSFPAAVTARFAPMSSSGGAWGRDGRLYVTGHDHAELYVLALPKGGATLDHLATIPAAIEGQAIAFDPGSPRVLYGISRARREIVALRLPTEESR